MDQNLQRWYGRRVGPCRVRWAGCEGPGRVRARGHDRERMEPARPAAVYGRLTVDARTDTAGHGRDTVSTGQGQDRARIGPGRRSYGVSGSARQYGISQRTSPRATSVPARDARYTTRARLLPVLRAGVHSCRARRRIQSHAVCQKYCGAHAFQSEPVDCGHTWRAS